MAEEIFQKDETATSAADAKLDNNQVFTAGETEAELTPKPIFVLKPSTENKAAVKTLPHKSMLSSWADALKRMNVYKGRTSRYDFWAFQSVSLVIFLLLALIGYYLSEPKMVLDIFAVYFLLPAASSCTRRLHDISMSGKWTVPAVILALATLICWNFNVHNMILLLFATLVYVSYLFGLWIRHGDAADNKYGPKVEEAEIYNLDSRAFISFMTTFMIGLWAIYIVYLIRF